jgi:hypothetical protein
VETSPLDKENAMILSTKNKVGLGIAALLGLVDLPSVLNSTPDGEEGPPFAVLVLSTICGVVTLVAVYLAWRQQNAGAIRVAAGARIVSLLAALPAFFVDVSSAIKVVSAVFVVVSVACVALMMSPSPRSAHVTD